MDFQNWQEGLAVQENLDKKLLIIEISDQKVNLLSLSLTTVRLYSGTYGLRTSFINSFKQFSSDPQCFLRIVP